MGAESKFEAEVAQKSNCVDYCTWRVAAYTIGLWRKERGKILRKSKWKRQDLCGGGWTDGRTGEGTKDER